MKEQARAQAILIVYEVIKSIEPKIELVKFESGTAYLKLSGGLEYNEDLHIRIQEAIDLKASNVSVYFS